MQTSRVFGLVVVFAALMGHGATVWANDGDGDSGRSGDQGILQQAANAMVFQRVFAGMAISLSDDAGVLELAHHIYELSRRGLQSIEEMAKACDLDVTGYLDPTALRRVGAMREVITPTVREQVYLDGQLLRLLEARQENLDATVRAKHAAIKSFAMRSVPEIEGLILKVRATVANWPTSDHL